MTKANSKTENHLKCECRSTLQRMICLPAGGSACSPLDIMSYCNLEWQVQRLNCLEEEEEKKSVNLDLFDTMSSSRAGKCWTAFVPWQRCRRSIKKNLQISFLTWAIHVLTWKVHFSQWLQINKEILHAFFYNHLEHC